MKIEIKDRATGVRQMLAKFSGKKNPVEVVHGYRFAAPVDVYVDGVLTPIPEPPPPPKMPPTRDEILSAVFSEASTIGGESEAEKIWDAFDAVPSFMQALDAMDYTLARKRAQKLSSTGKLTKAQVDRILAHVPA